MTWRWGPRVRVYLDPASGKEAEKALAEQESLWEAVREQASALRVARHRNHFARRVEQSFARKGT